ncbi:lantibiotic dehydratase [Hymenobacter siberiensis]|uniref:lantibiotic dehydratase n=1 Tax=Hymenobacter siberiensis TaxID=2848396 RepID=UPI001C1E27F3|nr:lantibiotic dehydratase [Hymenobacter siberiensis]MBU6120252.1 lantibiotic dehydratase [Hymenobacter siberiensis]
MPHAYQFHPQLILRTPTRPFDEHIAEATLTRLLHDDHFMEALYLASPVLWAECQKWQQGELTDIRRLDKLRRSLSRYYVRATTRCTPFGLFAGCAVVQWGATTKLIAAPEKAGRHTRLDMHYLCALAQQLAAHEAIRPQLRYWPNSSLYLTGGAFRYLEYYYLNGARVNQLSALEASPYLLRVLTAAQNGQSYTELVALLLDDDDDDDDDATDPAEATQFVEELIDSQVLVHELEPTVTGEEFFYRIQAVLNRVQQTKASPELAAIIDLLEVVRQQVQALDQAAVNSPASYEAIATLLAPLGIEADASKLFQIDTIVGMAPEPTLAATLQTELLEALRVLSHLTAPPTNPRLDDFRRRFYARYEDREVALVEALDNERGLSYTDYGSSTYSPLTHDLTLPKTAASGTAPALSEVQQFMRQKLWQAQQQQAYSLSITEAELKGFAPAGQPLPPSLAVVFRLLADGRILLESAAGSSAVNLLGRFAHAEPAIEQLVREVTAQEQQQNPNVAFAEICHLPASRVGNVLLRHSFRALEIPYLAQSALPVTEQVMVQDMLISVKGGQLVLRSRKTNQTIIPRLSTAHNFSGEALPMYQFLCDLQTQGLQPRLGFSWQSIAAGARFLPRLNYQNVVLEPASWYFESADVQTLLTSTAISFTDIWQKFRKQWQLPRLFVLVEGDNELLIDADNDLLVRIWLDAIRKLSNFRLKEFLGNPAASPVHDATGRPYAQQFIGLLVHQHASYPAPAPKQKLPETTVQRAFILGTEWLYYKLYCGQKIADQVLLTIIHPLTQELLAQGLIDNWFFIRYSDPDNHLRVRFHLPQPQQIGHVIQRIQAYLAPLSADGSIWKIQTETYQRELERYGPSAIALTEALFGYQSTALLHMLLATEQQPDTAPDNWLWGLGAIEELLNAFGYCLAQKVLLLESMRDTFAREFALDKDLKLQLATKYRNARPAIQQALAQAATTALPAALVAIAQQINTLAAEGRLVVAKNQLMSSYLHMLLNRLIPAEARLHELVLYDFLYRHYAALQAMQKRP